MFGNGIWAMLTGRLMGRVGKLPPFEIFWCVRVGFELGVDLKNVVFDRFWLRKERKE